MTRLALEFCLISAVVLCELDSLYSWLDALLGRERNGVDYLEVCCTPRLDEPSHISHTLDRGDSMFWYVQLLGTGDTGVADSSCRALPPLFSYRGGFRF